MALAGAFMFAGSITITRKLRDTHWLGLVFWQFLGSGLAGALASPIDWHPQSVFSMLLMCVVGVTSLAAFICITRALTLARASVVAPFTYTSIVWAGLMGWLVWGDVPSRNTVIGIAIIVASGLAVWWREQQQTPVAASAVTVP